MPRRLRRFLPRALFLAYHNKSRGRSHNSGNGRHWRGRGSNQPAAGGRGDSRQLRTAAGLWRDRTDPIGSGGPRPGCPDACRLGAEGRRDQLPAGLMDRAAVSVARTDGAAALSHGVDAGPGAASALEAVPSLRDDDGVVTENADTMPNGGDRSRDRSAVGRWGVSPARYVTVRGPSGAERVVTPRASRLSALRALSSHLGCFAASRDRHRPSRSRRRLM